MDKSVIICTNSESGDGKPSRDISIAEMVRQAVLEAVRAEREADLTQVLEQKGRELEAAKRQLAEANEKKAEYHALLMEAQKREAIVEIFRRLGVKNVELAYRAVRADVRRVENGQYEAENGEIGSLAEYLERFVRQNPELLPVSVGGGSGIESGKDTAVEEGIELDSIRPGMSQDEWNRARQYISRLLANNFC